MSEEWYEGAYFNRKFSLRFGDCDIKKKASLYTIMKLFSEIAGDDYEGRGIGHNFLFEQGQMFLVSRMSLKFDRIPIYSENIVARTWERTIKGPLFYRDYELVSASGEILVSGSSQWLLANPISREIVRPANLVVRQRQANPRKSDCPECKKIKKLDDLPIIGYRLIYYSDLDSNGHVNNAVYGKISVDFLPDAYRQREIKFFSINFNMETKLNEMLEIRGTETENGYIIQGISNDIVHFGCEFEY